MKRGIKLFLVIAFALHPCDGVSLRRQIQHIIDSRLQNLNHEFLPSRRFYKYDPREVSSILGVPSRPSHLPEAEPILPGHTLLRPALGMLKSSVKFPHKELEDGSGVYGNIDNLGLRYDARNERLLYSGFRRSPSDYIMVVPTKGAYYGSPRFKIVPAVSDLGQEEKTKNKLLKILKRLNIVKGAKIYVATLGGNKSHSHVVRTSAASQKGSVEKENESTSNEQSMNSESKGKMKSLLNSKNMYNNIRVYQNAPEFNELMPKVYLDDNIREWWYYNANDYTPFDD